MNTKKYDKYDKNLFDAKGTSDSMTVQNMNTDTIDDHKAVISADIIVSREWTRSVQRNNKNTDSYSYKMSACMLRAKTTLLKAGDYWYVPDWMPKAEKGEKIDAWNETDQEKE